MRPSVSRVGKVLVLGPFVTLAVACGRASDVGAEVVVAPEAMADEAQGERAAVEKGGSEARLGVADLSGLVTEAWYGVYLGGRKVGHVRRGGRLDAPGAAPWELTIALTLSMEPGGGLGGRELQVEEVRRYASSPPYALMETSYVQRGSGFEERRQAVREGASFRVTRAIGAEAAESKTVVASGETLMSQLAQAPPRLALLGEARGGTWPVWSWEQQRDHVVTVKVVGTRRAVQAGVEQEVHDLELASTEVPLPGTAEVTAGGLLLRSTLGSGLELKLEERAVAHSAVAGLDIASSGLPSPVALDAAAATGGLRFTLKLPAGLTVPAGPGQTVEVGAGAVQVTRRPGPLSEPLEGAAREALLASAQELDHAHAAVVAKRLEILKGVTGEAAQAEAIVKWVHGALRKELATHLPVASVVLARGVGDCTEHAWLAAALMRGAGLPARPVYGVAWGGQGAGGGGVFAFHAWVEVWHGGAWHAMDPTWGQLEADATHLRLGDAVGDVAAFLHGVEITAIDRLP
jgi:hypothetical protein